MQLLAGPGECDVEEATLLVDRVGVLGKVDGDEALLEPGQVHDRPLEALGRVEGDDLDGVAATAVLAAQRRRDPAHEPGHAAGGVEHEVLPAESHELGEGPWSAPSLPVIPL